MAKGLTSQAAIGYMQPGTNMQPTIHEFVRTVFQNLIINLRIYFKTFIYKTGEFIIKSIRNNDSNKNCLSLLFCNFKMQKLYLFKRSRDISHSINTFFFYLLSACDRVGARLTETKKDIDKLEKNKKVAYVISLNV